MKSLGKSLKEIFKPVAMALSAALVAAPLVTQPAQANVMNIGPSSLMLSQLQTDGYEPVGAGYQMSSSGQSRLVSFFANSNKDWIAVAGAPSGGTMQVLSRGSDLKVSNWAYTINVADKPGVQQVQQAPGAASQCAAYEVIQDRILKRAFDHSYLIEGKLANGDTMQTYVSPVGGNWMILDKKSDADQTTCRMAAGAGFQIEKASLPTLKP